MVEAVKARTSAAVALLGRSVNINSGTLNPDGFSEFVAQNLPGSTATISFAEAYPPMPGISSGVPSNFIGSGFSSIR